MGSGNPRHRRGGLRDGRHTPRVGGRLSVGHGPWNRPSDRRSRWPATGAARLRLVPSRTCPSPPARPTCCSALTCSSMSATKTAPSPRHAAPCARRPPGPHRARATAPLERTRRDKRTLPQISPHRAGPTTPAHRLSSRATDLLQHAPAAAGRHRTRGPQATGVGTSIGLGMPLRPLNIALRTIFELEVPLLRKSDLPLGMSLLATSARRW